MTPQQTETPVTHRIVRSRYKGATYAVEVHFGDGIWKTAYLGSLKQCRLFIGRP